MKGFTLVELLVSLLIIVILSSAIMIHGINKNSLRETETFTDLLQSRINLARQQSQNQLSIIGLRFDRRIYEFYLYEGDSAQNWTRLESKHNFWKKYRIPPQIRIELIVINSPDAFWNPLRDSHSPQIVFFPDGTSTHFTIIIHTENTDRVLQLKSQRQAMAQGSRISVQSSRLFMNFLQ